MIALGIHIVDLSKINDGTKKIYVYGWVEYNDVFPDTPRHRTEFCSQIVRVGDYLRAEGVPLGLHSYEQYNGADDECLFKVMTYEARMSEYDNIP